MYSRSLGLCTTAKVIQVSPSLIVCKTTKWIPKWATLISTKSIELVCKIDITVTDQMFVRTVKTVLNTQKSRAN